MRLFFALPVHKTLQLHIDQWRRQVLTPSNHWVALGNFHLTLAFLGELPHSQLERLCELVDDFLSHGEKPLRQTTLVIDHYGYWPKHGIFWIGPSEWPDSLSYLAQKLAQLGSVLGARKSKNPFTPHITLVRGCPNDPLPLATPKLDLVVDQVVLYQSLQARNGVYYEALASWPLPAPTSATPRPERLAHRRRRYRGTV